MSDRRPLACGLALAFALAAPVSLRAQTVRDSLALLRARLAHVDSQLGVREEARRAEEAQSAPSRHGRVQVIGALTVATHENVPRALIARTAKSADSVLSEFGGIPAEAIRSPILVENALSDTAALLAAPAFQRRDRLWIERWLPYDSLDDNGRRFVSPIAAHFRLTLDSTWRSWLPDDYGVYWRADAEGEYALHQLASENTSATGKECLAGTIRSCRYWLGIDADSIAYDVRYHPDELRTAINGISFSRNPGPGMASCRQGDDAACVRLFQGLEGNWRPLAVIPAPAAALASLLRSVRALHGADAVRRALADSAGSVGERLARVSGVSEDSLVAQWRMWVLSRGRPERVTAGMGEALSAIAFTVILVGLALRSGRWR